MKCPPDIIVQLIHIYGPMKGEIQEYSEGLVTIGRHPSCSLRFPADSANISRRHAELRREGNQFKLIDTSSNGTFVNGKIVKETFLKDGDVLEFAEGGPKVSFLTRISEVSTAAAMAASGQAKPEQISEIKVSETPEESYAKPYSPPEAKLDVVQPVIEAPGDMPNYKSNVPLTIQYGPTIRSYRELPVTIGGNVKSDFFLEHAAILDRHAQIFYSHNQYWIKDLTGQNLIKLNHLPIELQAPLKPDDEISLSPQGPEFCFLGEGRLAEIETASPAETTDHGASKANNAGEKDQSGEKASGGFWARFRK